jgi:hypothetical protein
MTGLSELSGALPKELLFQIHEPQVVRDLPFPGNLAVGLMSVSQTGGSESADYSKYIWAAHSSCKPVPLEGSVFEHLAHNRLLLENGQQQLRSDLNVLKTEYVLRNESVISRFLLTHRTMVPVLSRAIAELRISFGSDVVFNLEAIIEDDDSISLYAIVVWRGSIESADAALDEFDERWLLNQPPQSGLTFTYELA